MQFGHIATVQAERDGTVFVSVYDEVGRDLLQVASYGLSERGAGFRVEAPQFVLQRLSLCV